MERKYLTSTFLYVEANKRYKEIASCCDALEKRISQYPPDKIHVIKTNGNVQYYLRKRADDKSGEYINKKEEGKIKLYLQKRYDCKVYKLLKAEQKWIEKLLMKSKDLADKIQLVYSDDYEEVKDMVEPIDISNEDYIKKWINQSYIGKEVADNMPIYITNKDERVRSKSELNIANMLEKFGIPYKYEHPFVLSGGKVLYPDFTILRIRDRKEIYWEHRGMMDDREYARHAVQRLKLLAKENVIIGDNLIITEETQSSPLGTDEIEYLIKKWFYSI